MDITGFLLLPVRVSVAATQATLGLGQLASANGPLLRDGGYADRLASIFGEGDLLEQVAKILADERGPVGLANTLADLTAEDRPLGKALARDGVLDRLAAEDGPFVRLLQTGGPLDRALAENGPLDRLVAPGGPLDRFLAEEGAVDRLLAEGGLLDQLLAEDGILEKLLVSGGTLDQLVELGATFDAIVPRLEALGQAIPNLNTAVNILSGAVEPLGSLAGRLPGGRRRTPAMVEEATSEV